MNKLFSTGDRLLSYGESVIFDSYATDEISRVTIEGHKGVGLLSTKSLVFDAKHITFEKLCQIMKDNDVTGSIITDLNWAMFDEGTKQLFIQDVCDVIRGG